MRIARVNLILLVVTVITFFVLVLFEVNLLDYRSPIPYADYERITWRDFRGFKRPMTTLNGSRKFAFISNEIRFGRTHDGKLTVTTYFHPSRSYVFNQNIMQKILLRHELYHLHITELIARQIRMQLQTSPAFRGREISAIQLEHSYIERTMQRSYDFETDHGLRLGAQRRWEVRIDSSLNAMKEFSNPIIP